MKQNLVYIAKSLDGYIADKNGGLDWLNSILNPDNIDMGYVDFMNRIDAIIMGRNTYEMVYNFGGEWPYSKPMYVLSNTLKEIPKKLKDKVEIVNGSLKEVLDIIYNKGYKKLYIDGGVTVQNFLKEDLIDEMIITTMPVLLGGGTALFGELPKPLKFTHIASKVFLNAVVQDSYRRKI